MTPEEILDAIEFARDDIDSGAARDMLTALQVVIENAAEWADGNDEDLEFAGNSVLNLVEEVLAS